MTSEQIELVTEQIKLVIDFISSDPAIRDAVIEFLNKEKENEIVTIVKNYTEKSFIVVGNTKIHKEIFKDAGGKFNVFKYKGGTPGWLFPPSKLDELTKLLDEKSIDYLVINK